MALCGGLNIGTILREIKIRFRGKDKYRKPIKIKE
jgi:hypothetical protein